MADKGRRLAVCHPSAEVNRVLALTGLTDEGIVFDSTDTALAERFGHVVSRPFSSRGDHSGGLGVGGCRFEVKDSGHGSLDRPMIPAIAVSGLRR